VIAWQRTCLTVSLLLGQESLEASNLLADSVPRMHVSPLILTVVSNAEETSQEIGCNRCHRSMAGYRCLHVEKQACYGQTLKQVAVLNLWPRDKLFHLIAIVLN